MRREALRQPIKLVAALDLLGSLGLLPSLADEFFRRGVRNYIGTTWEIDDEGAIEFATHLYDALLGAKVTLGEAIRRARAMLQKREQQFGALWAAYQHYGDPTFSMPRADTQ